MNEFISSSLDRNQPQMTLLGESAKGLLRLHLLGDVEGALLLVEDAGRAYPLEEQHPANRPHSFLVNAYAQLGDVETARTLLTEYESLVPEGVRRESSAELQARANLALAEGRTRDAIAEFEQWHEEWGGGFRSAVSVQMARNPAWCDQNIGFVRFIRKARRHLHIAKTA